MTGAPQLAQSTRDKLQQLAFLHFQIKPARKLRKNLWAAVRENIRDQWAVVLGALRSA